MSDGADLLIPFAMCSAPACGQAASQLALPHLQRLLALLAPGAPDEGAAQSLSPPHERVLASSLGLASIPDGLIPWAAWEARQAGLGAPGDGWAWITPCHWRVATDHVAMAPPADLQLDGADSKALFDAIRPYFEGDGLVLQPTLPGRWLASGELFRELPTASIDRVAGRVIDPWIPRSGAARPLRRLQQEMQMLLYTHPVNDARLQRGLLPVNSFWVSGTGALAGAPPNAAAAAPVVADDLRDAALRDDAAAWSAAWTALDARECQRLLAALARREPVRITLCGERHARSWSGPAGGALRRLAGWLRPQPVSRTLEAL
jgi:hypothetical protein